MVYHFNTFADASLLWFGCTGLRTRIELICFKTKFLNNNKSLSSFSVQVQVQVHREVLSHRDRAISHFSVVMIFLLLSLQLQVDLECIFSLPGSRVYHGAGVPIATLEGGRRFKLAVTVTSWRGVAVDRDMPVALH